MMATMSRPSRPALSRLAKSICAGSPLPCSRSASRLTLVTNECGAQHWARSVLCGEHYGDVPWRCIMHMK